MGFSADYALSALEMALYRNPLDCGLRYISIRRGAARGMKNCSQNDAVSILSGTEPPRILSEAQRSRRAGGGVQSNDAALTMAAPSTPHREPLRCSAQGARAFWCCTVAVKAMTTPLVEIGLWSMVYWCSSLAHWGER
jgi:hypothetical protein